ncbi:unnamed protein product [Effrenium voratum]|nr:unnamed protein product [Effrenium voratum]
MAQPQPQPQPQPVAKVMPVMLAQSASVPPQKAMPSNLAKAPASVPQKAMPPHMLKAPAYLPQAAPTYVAKAPASAPQKAMPPYLLKAPAYLPQAAPTYVATAPARCDGSAETSGSASAPLKAAPPMIGIASAKGNAQAYSSAPVPYQPQPQPQPYQPQPQPYQPQPQPYQPQPQPYQPASPAFSTATWASSQFSLNQSVFQASPSVVTQYGQYGYGSAMPTMIPHQEIEDAVRRLHFEESEAPLSAVIVTISQGNTYDPLFQQVAQVGDNGTRVSTYATTLATLERLLTAMRGDAADAEDDLAQLIKDLEEVPRESAVFNWECCSACEAHHFGYGGSFDATTAELTKLLLDRGHMVMFSDFSLKALIGQWPATLGQNPFREVGAVSGSIILKFDPEVLKACPSSQLVKVGELCEEGRAEVTAMTNTIKFDVVEEAARGAEEREEYKLQRLTRAEGVPDTAGHVLLTYPSGGRLLASAGHWCEVVNLRGVTDEALFRTAERYYGQAYSAGLQQQLSSYADPAQREAVQQSIAQSFVLQSPPVASYVPQQNPTV